MEVTDYLDFMKDDFEIMPDDRLKEIRHIESYQGVISKLLNLTETLDIQDDESCQMALNLCIEAKSIDRDIESYRKKATEPLRKIIHMVNSCAKTFQERLGDIDRSLKLKIASWQTDQQIKAEEGRKQIRLMAESMGIPIGIIAPAPPRNISSAVATTCTREKKGFDIVDENLIPDEYWIVDEKAIQKHIDLGKRDIPGIKIKTEKTFYVRKK